MLRTALRRHRARKWNRERGWKYVGRTTRYAPLPRWPINLWAQEWVKIDGEVDLRHPGDAQPIMAHSYFITRGGRRHPFAALELSDKSWVFFVPTD